LDENLWYSNLFNIASHNLRGPLASITSNIEILSLKNPELKTGSSSKNIDRIKIAEGQLQKTINQWVNPGRIISDRNFSKTLSKFLDNYQQVEYKTYSSNIYLERTHQTALILAFEVFIDNAIEHGKASKIDIDLTRYPIISIKDTGLGMSSDKVRSFGSAQPSKIGNGLGTYFAKSILNQIGLEVSIHSTLGVGTTIILTREGNNAYEKLNWPLFKTQENRIKTINLQAEKVS
jgi:signal transduction histidine kinase